MPRSRKPGQPGQPGSYEEALTLVMIGPTKGGVFDVFLKVEFITKAFGKFGRIH